MNIEIYGYAACHACVKARKLLDQRGYTYVYRDIQTDAAAKAEMLRRNPKAKLVPQIFVGSRHIGGWEELQKADQDSALQQMIAGE